LSVLTYGYLYSFQYSRIIWPRTFYRSGWLRCVGLMSMCSRFRFRAGVLGFVLVLYLILLYYILLYITIIISYTILFFCSPPFLLFYPFPSHSTMFILYLSVLTYTYLYYLTQE
jgi:hypothetical protein